MVTTWPPTTLGEALTSLTVEGLKPLASLRVSPLPSRKDELIRVIVEALRDKEFVRRQVKMLDRAVQLALAEAVHGDGTVDPTWFRAKYGLTFPPQGARWAGSYYGYYGYYISSSDYGRKRDDAEVRPGLFFYHGRVPRDLWPILREVLPPPPPFVLAAHDELPATVPALAGEGSLDVFLAEPNALHDLVATLAVVRQGKLAVSEATHQPTGATVRLLRERYLVPEVVEVEEGTRADDAVRPFAYTMIVQAAGLARAAGTRLELTKHGQAALDAPSPALLKRCWEAWGSWKGLDEISRVRGIKGQKAKGQRFTPLAGRRAAIAAALAACPPGRWVAIDDFLRFVRVEHDFEVEASSETRLEVGYSDGYNPHGYNYDAWRAIVGSYVRAVLLEYAATLGLIDVATIPPEVARPDFKLYGLDGGLFSRYAGLCYLRLNPLGQYILGQAEGYEAPAPAEVDGRALRVLPNLDIVIADREALGAADRRLLERFAVQRSEDVFALERERLLEVVEEGFDLTVGRALLERLGGGTLPQTVEVLFQDMERRTGSVWEVGPAVLLRCSEPFVAQLISHDKALRKLCLQAGTDHLVVPAANMGAFRRGVKRLGYVVGTGEGAAVSRA